MKKISYTSKKSTMARKKDGKKSAVLPGRFLSDRDNKESRKRERGNEKEPLGS